MVTATVVTILFSCKNNFKEVQNIGILNSGPLSEAKHLNSKYTDSGTLKSILLSPKMLNYSNRKFAFYEFPQGIHLTFFDENNNKGTVTADYAIMYNRTKLLDLQKNVVVATHNNDSLFANQLFYDQEKEWIFTNQPVKFKMQDQLINGNGFDSNRTFTNAKVLEMTGHVYYNE